VFKIHFHLKIPPFADAIQTSAPFSLIALQHDTTALMDAASISNVNAQEVTQYCEVVTSRKNTGIFRFMMM
jgi:hypothetical protein